MEHSAQIIIDKKDRNKGSLLIALPLFYFHTKKNQPNEKKSFSVFNTSLAPSFM